MASLIRSETDIWILLYYIGEIFCVYILLSQIVGICYNKSRLKALNHESWVTKQGATTKILVSLFTTYSCSILGIAVVISRIGNHIYDPILCEYTYIISFMLFATAKLCNYYFFLQRAKLAQGLNKILPEVVFERVFPIIFILLYISYIIMIILLPIKGSKKMSLNTGRILCIWKAPDIEHQIIFFVSSIFDLFMTAFFLYLYGKPMCEIVRHSSKHSSSSTNTAEIKLRNCIMVNFICSSVSTIHTAIIALTWWNISFMSWWIIMDYVVNCISLFGMFASNRRLLLHCFCCHHKCMENRNNNKKIKHLTNTINESNSNIKALNVEINNNDNNNNKKIPLELGQRSSNMPSIHTISDFPQPQNVLNEEEEEEDVDGAQNRMHAATCSVSAVSPIIPPTEMIGNDNNNNRYKDAAERNGYISDENGINYIQYLDSSDNNSCWYYKSKLFWTWFIYYFCFCGNKSVCKCYICLCKLSICKNRIKSRKHVMQYMFGAAKKIQYNRYYARYRANSFNYRLNHKNSHPSSPNNRSQQNSFVHSARPSNAETEIIETKRRMSYDDDEEEENDDDHSNQKQHQRIITDFQTETNIELR